MAAHESSGQGTQLGTSSNTPLSSMSREDFRRVLAYTDRVALMRNPGKFADGSTCPHGLNISQESAADLCELKVLAWWLQIRGFACNRPGGCPAAAEKSLRQRFLST